MSKKIISYFTYCLYVIVTVIVLVEISSQIYVRTFRSDLVNQKDREDLFRLNMVKDWDSRFKASPYFGYTLASGNNYGFQTPQKFPLKRDNSTYIIAIIGGSVANNFGTYLTLTSTYEDLLRNSVPMLRHKDIQFVNLAIPGYKQPQQYFILSYFIDQVDYVIQLDGWNEAWVRTSHQFPADYPSFSEFFYSTQIEKKMEKLLLKKSFIDLIKTNSILSKSMAMTLVKSILEDDWNKTSDQLLVNNEKFFYKTHKTEEQLKEISIAAMSKYIRLEKDLLKLYNKKAHFFIQPSQYNKNSKPFSEWEYRMIFNKAENARLHTWAFQKVRQAATAEGSTDLAMIFKNEPESVYNDNCCHLNDLGNKILAKNIFEFVIKDLK